MIKIELNKLRVFKRLNVLEAKVAAIEAAMPSRPLARELSREETLSPASRELSQGESLGENGALGDTEGRRREPSGEKVPTAEEIMMMWRYTPEEIAEMNASGGSRG